jgi:DNA-binding response OmpR family regulator
MGDVLRKQTRRKAVRKVEVRSSWNVESCERTPEAQAMPAALVHLTTKEAQLLQFLAENPGRIFSRDSLLKMIWGYADGVTSRTVDVHIQRLRRKLKGNLVLKIHTIFGRGYVLEHPGKRDVTV